MPICIPFFILSRFRAKRSASYARAGTCITLERSRCFPSSFRTGDADAGESGEYFSRPNASKLYASLWAQRMSGRRSRSGTRQRTSTSPRSTTSSARRTSGAPSSTAAYAQRSRAAARIRHEEGARLPPHGQGAGGVCRQLRHQHRQRRLLSVWNGRLRRGGRLQARCPRRPRAVWVRTGKGGDRLDDRTGRAASSRVQ